jgi:hypothetical protein
MMAATMVRSMLKTGSIILLHTSVVRETGCWRIIYAVAWGLETRMAAGRSLATNGFGGVEFGANRLKGSKRSQQGTREFGHSGWGRRAEDPRAMRYCRKSPGAAC